MSMSNRQSSGSIIAYRASAELIAEIKPAAAEGITPGRRAAS
jgi:hypothetical protein